MSDTAVVNSVGSSVVNSVGSSVGQIFLLKLGYAMIVVHFEKFNLNFFFAFFFQFGNLY